MGIKRVINTDFWKDDVVAEQYSAEDRYFMLYLLSNPNTKQCGIYHLPVRTIAYEMGYKESAAQAILDRFIEKFNIRYSYKTNEIAILNYLKHSIVKGGKPVEDCIRKELSEVKDPSLIVIVYNHIKSHIDKQISLNEKSMYIGIDNVFMEFLKDLNNDKENDNDNDNENERIVVRIVDESSNEEKTAFSDESFEMKTVNYLITACKKELPNSKYPETQSEKIKWALEVEKMKRLDKRNEDEINQVLEYATTDSFWKTNIRSTRKLREKFETLYLQMKSKKDPTKRVQTTNKFNQFPQRDNTNVISSLEERLLRRD